MNQNCWKVYSIKVNGTECTNLTSLFAVRSQSLIFFWGLLTEQGKRGGVLPSLHLCLQAVQREIDATPREQRKEAIQCKGEEMVTRMLRRLRSPLTRFSLQAKCISPGHTFCNLVPHRTSSSSQWWLEIAGVSCVAWSKFGLQRRAGLE